MTKRLPSKGRSLPMPGDSPRINGSVRQGASAKRSRLYHTARWARTRRRVLDADPFCSECRKQRVLQLAEAVDPVLGPGPGCEQRVFDPRYLTELCWEHHRAKTALETMGKVQPQRLGPRPWTCPMG